LDIKLTFSESLGTEKSIFNNAYNSSLFYFVIVEFFNNWSKSVTDTSGNGHYIIGTKFEEHWKELGIDERTFEKFGIIS